MHFSNANFLSSQPMCWFVSSRPFQRIITTKVSVKIKGNITINAVHSSVIKHWSLGFTFSEDDNI